MFYETLNHSKRREPVIVTLTKFQREKAALSSLEMVRRHLEESTERNVIAEAAVERAEMAEAEVGRLETALEVTHQRLLSAEAASMAAEISVVLTTAATDSDGETESDAEAPAGPDVNLGVVDEDAPATLTTARSLPERFVPAPYLGRLPRPSFAAERQRMEITEELKALSAAAHHDAHVAADAATATSAAAAAVATADVEAALRKEVDAAEGRAATAEEESTSARQALEAAAAEISAGKEALESAVERERTTAQNLEATERRLDVAQEKLVVAEVCVERAEVAEAEAGRLEEALEMTRRLLLSANEAAGASEARAAEIEEKTVTDAAVAAAEMKAATAEDSAAAASAGSKLYSISEDDPDSITAGRGPSSDSELQAAIARAAEADQAATTAHQRADQMQHAAAESAAAAASSSEALRSLAEDLAVALKAKDEEQAQREAAEGDADSARESAERARQLSLAAAEETEEVRGRVAELEAQLDAKSLMVSADQTEELRNRATALEAQLDAAVARAESAREECAAEAEARADAEDDIAAARQELSMVAAEATEEIRRRSAELVSKLDEALAQGDLAREECNAAEEEAAAAREEAKAAREEARSLARAMTVAAAEAEATAGATHGASQLRSTGLANALETATRRADDADAALAEAQQARDVAVVRADAAHDVATSANERASKLQDDLEAVAAGDDDAAAAAAALAAVADTARADAAASRIELEDLRDRLEGVTTEAAATVAARDDERATAEAERNDAENATETAAASARALAEQRETDTAAVVATLRAETAALERKRAEESEDSKRNLAAAGLATVALETNLATAMVAVSALEAELSTAMGATVAREAELLEATNEAAALAEEILDLKKLETAATTEAETSKRFLEEAVCATAALRSELASATGATAALTAELAVATSAMAAHESEARASKERETVVATEMETALATAHAAHAEDLRRRQLRWEEEKERLELRVSDDAAAGMLAETRGAESTSALRGRIHDLETAAAQAVEDAAEERVVSAGRDARLAEAVEAIVVSSEGASRLVAQLDASNDAAAVSAARCHEMEQAMELAETKQEGSARAADRLEQSACDADAEASETIGRLRADIAASVSEAAAVAALTQNLEQAAAAAAMDAAAATEEARAETEAARVDVATACTQRDTALAEVEAIRREVVTMHEQEDAHRAQFLEEAEVSAENQAADKVLELEDRLAEAAASAARMMASGEEASAAAEEADSRCQLARREVARLTGENRAALARLFALEAAEVSHAAQYNEMAREAAIEAAAARAAAHSNSRAEAEASAGRVAAELQVEELRDELRRARGDVTSATTAALEMEKHMSASQRSAAEAVIKFRAGSASKELLTVRLRERESEVGEHAAALREERSARLRDQEAAAVRLHGARTAREEAETALHRCRLELGEMRAEVASGVDKLAASAAAIAAAEEVAADHATAAAELRARLFPNGDPDSGGFLFVQPTRSGDVDLPLANGRQVSAARQISDAVGGEVGGGGGSTSSGSGYRHIATPPIIGVSGARDRHVKHELTVLSARLHYGAEDRDYVDVTMALRARLAETKGERLVIKISDDLNDVIGGLSLDTRRQRSTRRPVSDGVVDRMGSSLGHGDQISSTRPIGGGRSALEVSLVVTYQTTTTRLGSADVGRAEEDGALLVSSSPVLTAEIGIGGMDCGIPFPLSSMWIEARPAAADYAARASASRVRDAEATAASARARAAAAEVALAGSRADLVATESSAADVERREANLLQAMGQMHAQWAAAAETAANDRDDADAARAFAGDAAARAARVLDQAHTAAERRVSEAVRKERLKADQRARELRLANAAARRITRSGGGHSLDEGGQFSATRPLNGDEGSWGHLNTPASAVAAATSSSTPIHSTSSSTVDARYKAQSRVNAALRHEADAWAAARRTSNDAGSYRPPSSTTSAERTPFTPAHHPILMNMAAPIGHSPSGSFSFAETHGAGLSLDGGSNDYAYGTNGGPSLDRRHQRSASQPIRENGGMPVFVSAGHDAPSEEAKRRADARVANLKRFAPSPSSIGPTRESGKAIGLAAKLARAESELRAALSSRDGRVAEVDALRRRAAVAEAAVTERDARLAAAHRRAALALASTSTSVAGQSHAVTWAGVARPVPPGKGLAAGTGDGSFSFRNTASTRGSTEGGSYGGVAGGYSAGYALGK
jgi:hypothetical protein